MWKICLGFLLTLNMQLIYLLYFLQEIYSTTWFKQCKKYPSVRHQTVGISKQPNKKKIVLRLYTPPFLLFVSFFFHFSPVISQFLSCQLYSAAEYMIDLFANRSWLMFPESAYFSHYKFCLPVPFQKTTKTWQTATPWVKLQIVNWIKGMHHKKVCKKYTLLFVHLCKSFSSGLNTNGHLSKHLEVTKFVIDVHILPVKLLLDIEEQKIIITYPQPCFII